MMQRIIFAAILAAWLCASVLVWQLVPEHVAIGDRMLASVIFPAAAVIVAGLTVVVSCFVLLGLWELAGWLAGELCRESEAKE